MGRIVEERVAALQLANELRSAAEWDRDDWRVTVRLDPVVTYRLLRVSERLGDTRSGVAAELLSAAIEEAWDLLGLGEIDSAELGWWLRGGSRLGEDGGEGR